MGDYRAGVIPDPKALEFSSLASCFSLIPSQLVTRSHSLQTFPGKSQIAAKEAESFTAMLYVFTHPHTPLLYQTVA